MHKLTVSLMLGTNIQSEEKETGHQNKYSLTEWWAELIKGLLL
jgi:hypothetical protein